MTLIKKFAWYGSSVAFATVLALALLVTGPAQTAKAATLLTVTMTNATNSPLAGSSVAASTRVATVTVPVGSGIIGQANADYLYTLTFPAGTTFTAGATTAANWAIGTTGTGVITATPVSVTASGTALTFRLTQTTGLAAADTVTFSSAAGGAGIVRFPTANGTLSVNIATNATPGTSIDSGSSSVTVVAITVSASPTSVPGDGLSTSVVTLVPAGAAATAGDIISLQTNNGQFIAAASAGATSLWGATTPAPSTTAPATSISGTTHAANAGAVNATATLRAPNTGVGSATVLVFITPAAGGSAQLIGSSVVNFTANTTVVPTLPVAGSVTPTAAQSTTLTGTTGTITATFTGAGGGAPISGGSVTINSTMGTLASTTGQTCVGQSCTGTLPAGGALGVTLTGTNSPGVATITFTTNGVSVTKTVTIAGDTATLTASVQADADGAGTGTAFVTAATPGAATFAAGGGVRVSVDPKDSAGNRVPSISPTITVSPNTCATIGATTASTGAAAATTVLTAGTATAGTVCTLTATVGTVSTTTTFTIGAALAATSALTVNAVDMAAVATQNVTVDVKDASGNKIQDGTSVTLVVSAGAVASASVLTVNGVATFIYVSPGTAQSVNLTAVAGSVNASKAISVGGAVVTPPAGGPGTFAAAPSFGTGNVGSAVFQGGTIEQLVAAVTAAGGTSVWVQDSNGTWRSYNTLATGSAAF
ncbi:MAG: hypothetical protein Q7K37_04615, partial [Dehalococcoidia bacterium]|nr:hypothetical protein [Dehalococcoidia bacterium]